MQVPSVLAVTHWEQEGVITTLSRHLRVPPAAHLLVVLPDLNAGDGSLVFLQGFTHGLAPPSDLPHPHLPLPAPANQGAAV